MSQQEEQLTLLQAVWYFITNPFVFTIGSMLGVMIYGAVIDSMVIMLCSFFIPPIVLLGYFIEDIT